MLELAPPPVRHRGRDWPSAELAALARGWQTRLRDGGLLPSGRDGAPGALVMTNHPHAVAAFFALTSLPVPLILLPPEPRGWRTAPAIPGGTPLVLVPALRHLAGEAERLGLRPAVLPEADRAAAAGGGPLTFALGPGLVFFTSGSTGLPRPVYRTMPAILAAIAARIRAFGLPPAGGVLGALPISRSFGVNNVLLTAAVLGAPLDLLDAFDPGATLAAFARGRCHFWAGTPAMADLVTRAAGAGAPPAPPVSAMGGRVSEALFHAFRSRFSVPLRSYYGATETGAVSLDAAPADLVRPGTAGTLLPGVEVRIGDDPGEPLPPGGTGRLWIRSPWRMQGYGFPPGVEPREDRDGFWPTQDLGRLDPDGYLTLSGRTDDCVRTAAGHLVNLVDVADVLVSAPGVTDAAVVPLESPGGPVIGVLVEGDPALDRSQLRSHLARVLPPWSWPRVLETTRELPRLPSGRTDRRACIAALQALL